MPVDKETLDQIVKRIDGNVEAIKIQTTKTNNRVTKLEKWKWKITGALGVILVILSPLVYTFFSTWLPKLIANLF